MRSERPDVARAYIRYRYKREIARESRADFLDAIGEKLEARNVVNQNANDATCYVFSIRKNGRYETKLYERNNEEYSYNIANDLHELLIAFGTTKNEYSVRIMPLFDNTIKILEKYKNKKVLKFNYFNTLQNNGIRWRNRTSYHPSTVCCLDRIRNPGVGQRTYPYFFK